MGGRVFERTRARLAGIYVGVLSGVYHGGPMAVMNLAGQPSCVRAGFSRWKMNIRGEERVSISEPHQVGVKRCQPLGQILSNSLLLYNRNGIDLQTSSRVRSDTPLRDRRGLVFCTWARCGASIYSGKSRGPNIGVFIGAAWCVNIYLFA